MENYSAIKKYKLGLQRWLSQVLGKPEDLSSIPAPTTHTRVRLGEQHAPHTAMPRGRGRAGSQQSTQIVSSGFSERSTGGTR